jgi:asparagine synthase (glutamine-hydrolysing)
LFKNRDLTVCGIAGAFAFGDPCEGIDATVVSRLNEFQRRRGPDGAGLWVSEDKRVALGHRRLAIIDTGEGGAQPMADASGRWCISFNGEIYNYAALKLELEKRGRIFRTNSDTEVLIHTIAEWGEAGLHKLRGMFAFALWDSQERELWLARDPYGIKPLYISESAGRVWFASQARALANCAPVRTTRNPAALTGYYLWGVVPEPFTWWEGIKMLPAGHLQRIKAGGAMPEPQAYARVEESYGHRAPEPLREGSLRSLLLDSVQHHFVADVPVGVFLSAGVDSSVIAALASELGMELRTVTLAFDEYAGTEHDEAPLAEATAKLLGSNHTTVRIRRDEFEAILDDFFACMDQPTIDGLNTYLVSRAAASQGLKVALSGLGGDELFGGYPSFRQIPTILKWGRRIPVPRPMGGLIESFMRTVGIPGFTPKVAGLISHSRNMAEAYLLRRGLRLQGELDALLDESWLKEGLEKLAPAATVARTLASLNMATPHAQIAALESCWYMRNQLLRDTDWSSMAHGLEVRVPFVDARLLEQLAPAIASQTPPSKRDLAACARALPPEMLSRPKTGFTTPVQAWIGGSVGLSARGSRQWASDVHRLFRHAAPGRTEAAGAKVAA